MTSIQKVIKYAAIAFGTYLSVVIIGCIIFGITTLFGITMGLEFWQQSGQAQEIAIESMTQEYTNVQNLKIDFNVCKLTIQEGEKLKVEASNVPEKMECKVEGNTMKIKDKTVNTAWFNQNNILPEVIITVPSSISLQKVDIKVGINDTKIENFNCETFEIETGVGKSEFQKIIANEMKIKGGAGRTVLEGITTDTLELDAGIGEMIFSGKILENADIHSGVGRLEMKILGNREDYQVKAKTGLGNFVIDGDKIRDNQTIGDGNRKIKVNAGLGETSIRFTSNEI